MNPTLKSLGFVFLILLIAAKPTTKPTTPTSQPAGTDVSIAKDQYHFPAPPSPEWTAIKPDPAADNITFTNTKHDGAMRLELLPKEDQFDANSAGNYATTVIKLLKEKHQKEKTEVVMQPTLEKDKRFLIVIHEKFKVSNYVEDELHVYKSVGPRILLLAAFSVSDDADKTAKILSDAENMLDAVKFNRKAFKKGD